MPSSASARVVPKIALVPYLPARRASPELIRSRSPSRFVAAASTSSATPASRLPPTQYGEKPAPVSPSTKCRIPKTSATRPSGASSDLIGGLLAPPDRLDRRLRQHQERHDHHREVRE